MKDYSLLVNPVYLYLIENPNIKINYSKMGKELSLTRQTAAKYYKEVEEAEGYPCMKIPDLHKELIDNKYLRALAILKDIDEYDYTMEELSKILGVSKATLEKYAEWINQNYHRYHSKELPQTEQNENIEYPSAVYGCFYNDELIYVGSTSNYHSRIQQHYSMINMQSNNALSKFLQNKDLNKLKFVPFILGLKKEQYQILEKNLIRTLKPRCNVEFR